MTLDKTKKIVVVGGGGIGGITAAYLKDASFDVTLYDIDEAHVEHINKNGLVIDGVRGKKTVMLPAVTSLTGTFDIFFLSVKSLHTVDALNTIKDHMNSSSVVVSLQNGINEEIISEKISEKQTIGCVVGWGATNLGPGHLSQTSKGKFIIGRLDGTVDPQLEDVKNILDQVTETVITDNILGHLWSKLLINCCIATIGVCFAADVKKLVSNQKMIPIMVGLTEELVRVAEYAEIRLEKFEDVLDMGLFRINDFDDYKRAVAIMKLAGRQHKGIKSSMWQDVEKGRRTEIDYINGYVERKAIELGISTPMNKALIQLVKDIEQGKRSPSEENVEVFYENVRIPQKWIQYDIDADPYVDLALFNLPSNYKHEQLAKVNGLQVVGLLTAFSKAFEKLTNSVIGKLFVRKSAWELVNLVLSKYIEQLGEKFARNVMQSFSIEEKDAASIVQIYSFFLTMQHIPYEVMKLTKEGSTLFIPKDGDPYVDAAKLLNVTEKIETPITIQLLKAMVPAVNDTIGFQFEETELKEKQGYQITVRST
jgi:2-dehydropantoate 2-reductase